MEHDRYVRVYENILDDNLVKNIMDLQRDVDWEYWDREGRPQFHQFNVTDYAERNGDSSWAKVHNRMIEAIKDVCDKYMADVGCQENW